VTTVHAHARLVITSALPLPPAAGTSIETGATV
jgi:hypothetical protein